MDKSRKAPSARVVVAPLILAVVLAFGASGANCETPPAPCDAKPCKQGEEAVCGDKCVRPRQMLEPCSTDLCATDGRCAAGLTCVPDTALPGGTGNSHFCFFVGGTVGAPCQTDLPFDPCSNDLYCHDRDCFGGRQSECALPAPENGACDSDSSKPKCNPCIPGTTCVDLQSGSGFCHKPCKSTADCPCEEQCFPTNGPGTTNPGTACYPCNGLHGECSDQEKCCDAEQRCESGACCIRFGAPCKSTADCCGGSEGRCIGSATGNGATCQACRNTDQLCSTTADCCIGNECVGGVCLLGTDHQCKHDSDCADGSCICGLCSEPLKPGEQCGFADVDPSTSDCLCRAGGGSTTTCDDKSELCCVTDCGLCTLTPGSPVHGDCCVSNGIGVPGTLECQPFGAIHRCCRVAGGECTSNADCCSDHVCMDGHCNFVGSGKNPGACLNKPPGCSVEPQPCGGEFPDCCPAYVCENGACKKSSGYALLGYDINLNSSTPLYKYMIPSCTPIALAAAGLVYVIEQSPNALIAVDVGNLQMPIAVVDVSLPVAPRTVALLEAEPGVNEVVTLGVGATNEADLYVVSSGTNQITQRVTTMYPTPGATLALSPNTQSNPNITMDEVTVVTPSDRIQMNMQGATIEANVGMVSAVDVGTTSAIDGTAYIVASGGSPYIAAFGIPALLPINGQQAFFPTGGVPVSIAVTTFEAVALDVGLGLNNPVLLTYEPDLSKQPTQNDLPGTPVRVRLFGKTYVATKNQNAISVFKTFSTGAASKVLQLPGEPIDFIVTTPKDQNIDGGVVDAGNETGFVHVLVRL